MPSAKYLRYALPAAATIAVLTVSYVVYMMTSKKELGVFASPVAPIITLHPDNKTKRMV